MGEHFDQAHHRQFAGVGPGVEPGGAHAVATDAGEFRIGEALAQFVDEAGAQLVAGGFACAERDAHGYRSNGRSPASMKSSMARTSSLPAAISSSSALASSSLASPMYRAR